HPVPLGRMHLTRTRIDLRSVETTAVNEPATAWPASVAFVAGLTTSQLITQLSTVYYRSDEYPLMDPVQRKTAHLTLHADSLCNVGAGQHCVATKLKETWADLSNTTRESRERFPSKGATRVSFRN